MGTEKSYLLLTIEKRRKNKASKKDINKYLKNQNKKENENFNNPFADALAKLKK